MAPFSDEYLYVEIASKALFWQQAGYYGVNLTSLHQEATQAYFSQVGGSLLPGIIFGVFYFGGGRLSFG